MSLVETLLVIQLLLEIKPEQRLLLSRRLLRYFFLNPVKILSCPFLQDQDCLIYQNRFFGCRAYGLWSEDYYREQAEQSRQAKSVGREQWKSLGISLPQEVVDFQVDYCPYVELEEDVSLDDELLLQTYNEIEAISTQLAPWHERFRQGYFSDLSFLLVALSLDLPRSIQLKLEIVQDFLGTGNEGRINDIIDELDRFLAGLMT
jgi:Fe-S-cluster containining protein